ncbi:hypothetical protein MTP09_12095 [Chryseobacterium suipulveris]|uniref:Yip1 domain-containing protein n=1 Tax=Chryseobacterium suipulveris TaxID=2929800 RepID=A0ABY4BSF4_9FLAO|nr:YIP1 family protein [Chryseobacterium suipulveris]UOE40633.1 hypothetical protein MTP09_12095 [Chryseobacterium suipulveris]
MNWKLFFNPFEKFSEIQLLVFGIIITILGSFIGSSLGVIYDGVFDVHVYQTTFAKAILVNFINILSVFVPLLILGKIINSKTRIIDILNVSLISRFPIYIAGLLANNEKMNGITENILKEINTPEKLQIPTTDLIYLMVFSSLMMILLVYSIVLMFSGFRTATNVKKWQHFIFFAIAIIVAELISKVTIGSLLDFWQ